MPLPGYSLKSVNGRTVYLCFLGHEHEYALEAVLCSIEQPVRLDAETDAVRVARAALEDLKAARSEASRTEFDA